MLISANLITYCLYWVVIVAIAFVMPRVGAVGTRLKRRNHYRPQLIRGHFSDVNMLTVIILGANLSQLIRKKLRGKYCCGNSLLLSFSSSFTGFFIFVVRGRTIVGIIIINITVQIHYNNKNVSKNSTKGQHGSVPFKFGRYVFRPCINYQVQKRPLQRKLLQNKRY